MVGRSSTEIVTPAGARNHDETDAFSGARTLDAVISSDTNEQQKLRISAIICNNIANQLPAKHQLTWIEPLFRFEGIYSSVCFFFFSRLAKAPFFL